MKKIFVPFYLLIGLSLLAHFIFADTEIVYVAKKEVKIKAGPDETIYETVETVKYRDSLEILEKKDDWYKIKAVKSGKTGWIYKKKVSSAKPERDKSTGEVLGKLLRGGSGSETTETAAAAGIRDFDKKNYGELKGDFKAVERMEALRQQISDKDIVEFMREGKLK
ncbi:MAG: SH3 domain-containing protein [Planctomycetota bacterium]